MTSSWSFGECEGLLIWRDVILYTREFIHHGGLGDRPAGFQCVQIQPGNKSGGVHFALRPQKRDGLFGGRGGGGGRKGEGSTADTARKRPERPWTAARTMEVLRRCPLAIAQRLVHCATAVSIPCLGRVTRTMSVRCTAVEEQPEAKEVQLSQPSSTSLIIISSGLT